MEKNGENKEKIEEPLESIYKLIEFYFIFLRPQVLIILLSVAHLIGT